MINYIDLKFIGINIMAKQVHFMMFTWLPQSKHVVFTTFIDLIVSWLASYCNNIDWHWNWLQDLHSLPMPRLWEAKSDLQKCSTLGLCQNYTNFLLVPTTYINFNTSLPLRQQDTSKLFVRNLMPVASLKYFSSTMCFWVLC